MKAGWGETSATLQPFFTLQLDIQHEMVGSVEEALLQNFASEQLDGYICSKTRQQVGHLSPVTFHLSPVIRHLSPSQRPGCK